MIRIHTNVQCVGTRVVVERSRDDVNYFNAPISAHVGTTNRVVLHAHLLTS